MIADAHVDLLMELAYRERRLGESDVFASTWLPLFEQGGVGLQVCAVYVDLVVQPEGSLREALSMVAAFQNALRENAHHVKQVTSAADLDAVEAGERIGLYGRPPGACAGRAGGARRNGGERKLERHMVERPAADAEVFDASRQPHPAAGAKRQQARRHRGGRRRPFGPCQGEPALGDLLDELVQGLCDQWAVPVERIALIGHSQGGLMARSAVAGSVG